MPCLARPRTQAVTSGSGSNRESLIGVPWHESQDERPVPQPAPTDDVVLEPSSYETWLRRPGWLNLGLGDDGGHRARAPGDEVRDTRRQVALRLEAEGVQGRGVGTDPASHHVQDLTVTGRSGRRP